MTTTYANPTTQERFERTLDKEAFKRQHPEFIDSGTGSAASSTATPAAQDLAERMPFDSATNAPQEEAVSQQPTLVPETDDGLPELADIPVSAPAASPKEHAATDDGILSEENVLDNARAYVRERPNLKRYNGDWHDHIGNRYVIESEATLRSRLLLWLDKQRKRVITKKGESIEPFLPTIWSTNEIIFALKAVVHVNEKIKMPCWLDGRAGPNPENLISFPNGNLNIDTDEFTAPDPMLFSTSAVGFDYDPAAPDCVELKKFLCEIFDNEQEQIDSIQEAIGYTIAADVSQEKGFMFLGDKRSGKDTVKNVLRGLLPDNAFAGPTFDALSQNFGLSQLIGKSLCIIGDMRIGSRTNEAAVVENVLKLTGRSLFTFDRKYKAHWTGFLPCKLWAISNERPILHDTSGAFASRFIIYRSRVSFYGREIPNFYRDKLQPELPGILLWALAGLRRMRKRGRIAEPACSRAEQDLMARDGSPVQAFIAERLVVEMQAHADKDSLYSAWVNWAAVNGLFVKSRPVFFRDLHSATGGRIQGARIGTHEREYVIKGVRLKTPADERAADAGQPKMGGI